VCREAQSCSTDKPTWGDIDRHVSGIVAEGKLVGELPGLDDWE